MYNADMIYKVNDQGMIVEEIEEPGDDLVIPYDSKENWIPDGYIQPEQSVFE
jgi:hypothetical protein